MWKALIRYWLPVALWAVVIFLFSSLPTGTATEIVWTDFVIKKTAHMIEYGVLAVLIYRALRAGEVVKRNAAYWAIMAAVVYGVSDEFHQSFTPGRMPRAYDIGFDTIGAVLAIYSVWNILPKAPARLRKLAKELEVI